MSRKILLGVSGGIAAYKACELVRAFKKRGDQVRVVMTEGAQEFVRPMTFQVLSENPVGVELFDPTYESQIGHIDLARWPDVILLAPATADLVARMAHGMADDLLTTVLLATTAPVVVAPAMNTQMWLHPRTQENLELLAKTPDYTVVTPDAGELACKEVGPGRLPDPPVLLAAVERAMTEPELADKKVLITAGPTREFIDPARFISNPSTGKMGQAIAQAAYAMGAQVTLVRGPVTLEKPYGVEVIDVTTARQMREAVMARVADVDFAVMTAAVADWRPENEQEQKVSKSQMAEELKLTRNPDILAELGARFGPGAPEEGPIIIGFAAETHDVVERGRAKMLRKGAHLMVANQIGGVLSTFGADQATIHVLSASTVTNYPLETKASLGRAIWHEALRFARVTPS